MTDNEIIKALKCRIDNFSKSVLDLINRQKEEIERLEKELMKCKIEKEMLYNVGLEIQTIAIKEFAENLEYFVLHEDIEVVEPKCKDYESYINGANQFRHQIKNGIKNLVKEMTEVETNHRKEDEGK